MIGHSWISMYTKLYRHGNLVYARSFGVDEHHWVNFFISLGWQPITIDEVNWDLDHVFSFIIDPVERRNRALVESIVVSGTGHLIDDPGFQKLICYLPMSGLNSMSLTDIWQDYTNKITWLPDDLKHVDGYQLLVKFAEAHNPNQLPLADLLSIYPSNWVLEASASENSLRFKYNTDQLALKTHVLTVVEKILGNGVHYFWQSLSKDLELYRDVCVTHIE